MILTAPRNEAALRLLGLDQFGSVVIGVNYDAEGQPIEYIVPDDLDLSGYDAAVKTAQVIVPASVSSAQAKIQLRRAGLRDKVNSAVQAAGGEVLDWFTDARAWDRMNQHVLDIGGGLNLKPADIDALFIAAAQIEA